mmetsp:Transcript_4747/g.8121  ORF Transcript_4747/g.8121 Transcript_4747/m.8121 type:complete len:156 (-) Transcript_4747:166-633(-)
MSVDILPDDSYAVITSMVGEIFVMCLKTQEIVYYKNTLVGIEEELKQNLLAIKESISIDPIYQRVINNDPSSVSNILYCSRAVKPKTDPMHFLVGGEDSIIHKYSQVGECFEEIDRFVGHSNGIRSIELSKDGSKILTGCQDHSLRIWDYKECKG